MSEVTEPKTVTVPELSLVVLIGPSGSGKSTFARRAFKSTEVLSSDFCRALVSDDENAQAATKDAFDVLHFIAAKRLAAGKLTVIDATNVQPEARKPLLALAREHDCPAAAIVLNVSEEVCVERNKTRVDRQFGPHVVRQHVQQLRRSLKGLGREGFRYVSVLSSPEEVETAVIKREPSRTLRLDEHGPFDIIGDIHGCCDELEQLLETLGYERDGLPAYRHAAGRKAVFLGDIVDRGPRTLDTIWLVKAMVEAGTALCVPGNHDRKLSRKLQGRDVQVSHGLETSLAEIEGLDEAERDHASKDIVQFFESLVSHYVLDSGKLVVAHAGMRQEFQGRASNRVRNFALYGETTGETDEYGLPVRYNWAAEYRGRSMVVYGHTPVLSPEWLNGTINVDTGCVFGGSLTALRYPERELVSVPAARVYYEPARPLGLPAPTVGLTAQQAHDDLLDIEDVLGKRIISTRLHGNVTIREENAGAALEVMSRFAVNPKWLIYLPPTMAPPDATAEPGFLEYPTEAFAYFRSQGIRELICEEKHMGSRAVIVVCRDEETARHRFGVEGEGLGCCYTRTGRRFFDGAPAVEAAFLARVVDAMGAAGMWEELNTDWLCLDCELMPWSLKASELLRQQYAPAGSAAAAGVSAAIDMLEQTNERTGDLADVLERFRVRRSQAARHVEAYGHYCWEVDGLEGVKLAPFHLLASDGAVHSDRDHGWHMQMLARLAAADPLFVATPSRTVDLEDIDSEADAVSWWRELTSAGGEGIVVKPLSFIARGKRGLVQPAVKCRGAEYLRIIYGPEYDSPRNLERLRSRQVGGKRSLALREFALGIEALERFARAEPLRRVHECVFGVLALESEPIDPRL